MIAGAWALTFLGFLLGADKKPVLFIDWLLQEVIHYKIYVAFIAGCFGGAVWWQVQALRQLGAGGDEWGRRLLQVGAVGGVVVGFPLFLLAVRWLFR